MKTTLFVALCFSFALGCASKQPAIEFQPQGGSGIAQASAYVTSNSDLLAVLFKKADEWGRTVIALALQNNVYAQNALVVSQKWYDQLNGDLLKEHDRRIALETDLATERAQWVGDRAWRNIKIILAIGIPLSILAFVLMSTKLTLGGLILKIFSLVWRR